MLEWLGQKHEDSYLVETAERMRAATSLALKSGEARTVDLGGKARTNDCRDAICKALE